MSLYKQLWLAIVFLLLLVFSSSFLVSSLSAKNYLEQQLSIKNADNATALALSLTQQGADQVLLELTLSAQFDTGFYEMIQLTDPDGKPSIYRVDDQPIESAPAWFIALFPIKAEDGHAAIQAGWQQVGTLTVRSHSRFAYEELWANTQALAIIFLCAMIGAGFLGSHILKSILRPLDQVVEQAKAMGERRFISIEEPKTKEFRQLVKAMNELSHRVKALLHQEAKRLEKWQREAHVDKVSGLLNREPYLKTVEAALESDDVNATGSLSIIRLSGLANLNQMYGRKSLDAALHDIGEQLNRIVMEHSRWAAARLNGSDFSIFAPRATDPIDAAQKMQDVLKEVLANYSMDADLVLPGATTIFQHGDKVGDLLTRLDGTIQSSEHEELSAIGVAHEGDIQMQSVREQMDQWRFIFDQSFHEHNFSLDRYPVVGLQGEVLHFEAPARLTWKGNKLSAGQFLPWINRLQMSAELDKHVIDLALQSIKDTGDPVGINLSVAAVFDRSFLTWISERLARDVAAAEKLSMEVSEPMAFRHLENFKLLCTRAHNAGCKVGIEHMGHQLSEIGKLHDLGIDYLKIDATFVRDIEDNPAIQTLLRTLCTIGHSIGVVVYAEGVRSEAEWEALKELGMDGGTGPGFEQQYSKE